MDSITVKISTAPDESEIFHLVTDDFHEKTSAVGISALIDATGDEIPCRWSPRLPRVYVKNGKVVKVLKSLKYSN